MFRLIDGPTIITVNPRKAEKYLLTDSFVGDRNPRPSLVNLYSRKMRQGIFRSGEIATARLNYNGGSIVRVNGQHVCHAVIVTGSTIKAKFEHYECETPEDLALLYAQFDTSGGRSLTDLVKVRAGQLGLSWPGFVAGLVVSAAVLKEKKQNSPKSEKVELLDEYRKEGSFVNYVFNESIPELSNRQKQIAHLKRSPVVYAMMLTWEKHQGLSRDFWISVRDGEDMKATMPAFRLRDFLRGVSFDRGRGAKGNGLRVVGQHEMTSRCVTAWNAFRRGKLLRAIVYYPGKPIPKAI